MKKVSMLVVVFMLFASVTYASQPYFKLQIDTPGEIFSDEVLKLNISVTDYVYGKENPTSAIDFSVLYNSDHFEYIGLTTRDGFHASVGQSVYEDVYSNNRVLMGMIGGINTISSDTDLVTLNFRPKAVTYKSQFTLHSAKASTSTGFLFTPGVSSMEITIANLYDVNRDGFINLSDLGIVSYNVGKDPVEHYYSDINRDGVIDIEDVNILMDYLLNNDNSRIVRHY